MGKMKDVWMQRELDEVEANHEAQEKKNMAISECARCKIEWEWSPTVINRPGPDICPKCEEAQHDHELARAMDEEGTTDAD
jgi:hypothetical protein